MNLVWSAHTRRRLGALFALGLAACSADHHVQKGDEALDQHDLPTAENAYRAALERHPEHLGALAGLGWTYYLAGQKKAARSAFSRCVDIAPEHANCLRGLGSLALAEGQPGLARELLGRARAAAPDDPKVLSSVALIDLKTGREADARTAYVELAARFPDDAAYRVGLAEATLRTGDAEGAIQVVEDALALPQTPRRYTAMLWQLKARALVMASGGREDPTRCEETAPPVRAWLDAAEAAVAQAEAASPDTPDLPAVRRQVLRRRAILDQQCPMAIPSAASVLGDAPPTSPVDELPADGGAR